MPLVRFEVKNEYALGEPELYRAESKKEDPKTVLDGVAVAGLVGILRQLGDLAGFAADIFRDLHDEAMTTAARGRKMLTRVKRIESELPSLEKAVQGQKSHIHFAYIAGSDWHANVRTGQNQLLCSDLPQFMIDFYEECRDPPRLCLLDRFDESGAGACLKRYSDPSYFKKALSSSQPVKVEKVKRKKKNRGSRLRNGVIGSALFTSRDSNSSQFASLSMDQIRFSEERTSFPDAKLNSELAGESTYFDSETRPNSVEQVSDMPCMVHCDPEYEGVSSASAKSICSDPTASVHNEPNTDIVDDDSQPDSLRQQSAPSTSSVTWDEKTEIVKPTGPNLYSAKLVDSVQDSDSTPQTFETSKLGNETAEVEAAREEDIVFELAKEPVVYSGGNLINENPTEMDSMAPVSCPTANLFDEIPAETDNFIEAANTLETEMETDFECQTKLEFGSSNFACGGLEYRSCGLTETGRTNSDCSDAQAPIAVSSSSNNFVPSDCFDHVQSTNTTCDAPVSESAPESESFIGDDYSKTHISCLTRPGGSDCLDGKKFTESNVASYNDVLVNDGTAEKTAKSQNCPSNASNLPSVRFWTNGGILGVEPSKPPDFSINANLEAAVTANGSKSITLCTMEERDKSNIDIPVRKNSEDSIQRPLVYLDKTLEAPSGRTCAYTGGPDDGETDATASVSDLTTMCSNVSHSNGSDKKLPGISTGFSGLAHKFLSNSLQRRILVAHAGLSAPSKLVNADFKKLQEILLQNDHKDLPQKVVPSALCEPELEESIGFESPGKPVSLSALCFGSSSPPLEHMKISFQALNGLDTSKLKLEFSSGNLPESSGDSVFPSFHLIPRSSTTLHDSCSDSDDDTFCRSSAFSSNDLLSPHSESSSGFWEEDEKSENQKHNPPEQMGRCSMASEEHTEAESGRIDCIQDLPSISSVICSKDQPKEICEPLAFCATDSVSLSPNVLPPSVPLLPSQWRVVKQSDQYHTVEDQDCSCTDFMEHVDALSQSFAAQQLEEVGASRSPCNAEAVQHPDEKTDQQMLSGKRGPNHNWSTELQNGKEHLLQQIRSEASYDLNLRP